MIAQWSIRVLSYFTSTIVFTLLPQTMLQCYNVVFAKVV